MGDRPIIENKIPMKSTDPMDKYSVPLETRDTNLSKIFKMSIRTLSEKPGRSLGVIWDKRFPLVDGFHNNYSYYVSFGKEGHVAGNHFHEKKQELFYPVMGKFKILLQDTVSRESEEIDLDANNHEIMYIAPKITHAVVSLSMPAILLVVASSPNINGDEYPRKLI